jgi:hypothetical protein
MAQNINQITAPRVDFLDQNGKITREWYMYLYNLYTITGGGTGITPVVNGGTGLGTIPTNGQLLIGNGDGYTLNTLGYGAGISVTNGVGQIIVANTGVLSNIAGAGISVSGATGNVTIANTGVLSFAGGTTGLTPAAAATGAVTLAGKLVIANGGTNSTATPTAYGVAYGTGSAYAFTAAGTTGQVLTATTGGAPTWAAPATSGTVTSVGLSLPSQFTVTNSPVTSSGTLTGSWNNQTANYVLAGPTTGAAAAPTFRALVSGDIPSLSYVTSVTGTAPVVSSGGLTPAISMAAANTSTNGYLTSTDWNTFNNKGSGTVTSVTGTAPVVSSGGATPAISMAAANTTTNGYLTSTDWNTFNNKGSGTVTSVAALTLGTTGTDLSSTVANGTTTPVITLNVPTASATNRGALSAADWTTFNSKGSGSVTSVSVVSANGFAGTVATATTTPAITLTTTITGLLKGNGTAISAATANTDYMGVAAPVTKTADFTVSNGDIWYINNKSGSTCTVTLPAASSWTGRSLTFKNMQAQSLVSASSNVVPIDSTVAGTAILLNVVGNWATMVSDGTNWVIMQAASNNNLLLE